MPDWPLSVPPWPKDLSGDQLGALRELTRYACGKRKREFVFPDLSQDSDEAKTPKARKAQQLRNARRDACAQYLAGTDPLEAEEFDNFRRGNSDLDFAGTQAKIKRIYAYLYTYLRDDLPTHSAILGLMESIYRPEEHRFERVARELYKFSETNAATVEYYSDVLSGCYWLYRRGTLPGKRPEVVRSAVRIEKRGQHDGVRLRFTVAYVSGFAGQLGSHEKMEGVIIPEGDNLFFWGRDDGTDNFIYLVTNRPGKRKPARLLKGIMLRRSTRKLVASMRFVLIRARDRDESPTPGEPYPPGWHLGSGAPTKDTGASQQIGNPTAIDQKFEEMIDFIALKFEEEFDDEVALIKNDIDNAVDNKEQFVLSLI